MLIAAVPVAAIHGGLAEWQRFRSVLDIVPAGGHHLADVNDTIAYAQYLNRLYEKTRSRLLHNGCVRILDCLFRVLLCVRLFAQLITRYRNAG